MDIQRIRIKLSGMVQGVGLRPLVYNLAREMELCGWVSNSSSGAVIEIEGGNFAIKNFPIKLKENLPQIAFISNWREENIKPLGEKSFSIISSLTREKESDLFCPDIAFCDNCKSEFLDKSNRRYKYPFIGCPSCGPRFTAIENLPYDRIRSSMSGFKMCPQCLGEYSDPQNRRFHNQLNCCPDCGPQLELWRGTNQLKNVNPLEEAIKLLKEGNIIAIKGLGGFHLAADATNFDAVKRLRERKRRPAKPLALMSTDFDKIKKYCRINVAAGKILSGPSAPITLLPKLAREILAKNITQNTHKYGVMLPYTPLHYLLSEPFLALVLTSGNSSDEPLVIDNEEAIVRLSGLADYILLHNRPIQQPCDDSVVNIFDKRQIIIRRSRGLGPKPLITNQLTANILACGAEQKNTFAISGGERIYISQHLGDLKSSQSFNVYKKTIEHFKKLLKIEPQFIAHDLHPDYLSSQYAKSLGIPSIGIAHHHAHIAAVMGEHKIQEPVIGLAWDGSGLGDDGNLWGGEFMIADLSGYERIAHFDYIGLPGGDRAVKEPWRTGFSLLRGIYGGGAENIAKKIWNDISDEQISGVDQMLIKGINSPRTSSCGRLFDGAAAILGLGSSASFEGQLAIILENAAHQSGDGGTYPYEIMEREGRQIISPSLIIASLIEDHFKKIPINIIARRFHNSLALIIEDICVRIRNNFAINKVILSGGVFQNELLATFAASRLETEGFEVFFPKELPPNDGAVSFGQLLIANDKIKNKKFQ